MPVGRSNPSSLWLAWRCTSFPWALRLTAGLSQDRCATTQKHFLSSPKHKRIHPYSQINFRPEATHLHIHQHPEHQSEVRIGQRIREDDAQRRAHLTHVLIDDLVVKYNDLKTGDASPYRCSLYQKLKTKKERTGLYKGLSRPSQCLRHHFWASHVLFQFEPNRSAGRESDPQSAAQLKPLRRAHMPCSLHLQRTASDLASLRDQGPGLLRT